MQQPLPVPASQPVERLHLGASDTVDLKLKFVQFLKPGEDVSYTSGRWGVCDKHSEPGFTVNGGASRTSCQADKRVRQVREELNCHGSF